MSKKDTLYQGAIGEIKPFEFNQQVADVFPDMIQRSVPGYADTLVTISTLAHHYAQPGSRLYDLGCSLGAASIALAKGANQQDCTLVAVDNSAAMIERCQKNFNRAQIDHKIELLQADIRDVSIAAASLVVMNYTLQFIPVNERGEIINKIFHGLNDGGVCVISEKICFAEPDIQATVQALHEGFKRQNGYDDMEITAKRNALENVLVTETKHQHQQRLFDVGFSSVIQIRQALNFITLLAIK